MYLYAPEQKRGPSEHGIGQSPPVSPWPHRAKWTDFAAPGTADTYTLAYSKWVASNYQNYNKDKYYCNWFPLRLLVEFASQNLLRIRMRYWPGTASTTGGVRQWDMSTINVFDSRDGGFTSKDHFYGTVKNKVTARMIAELNTVPIPVQDARAGDLILYPMSDRYWHVEEIVEVTSTELVRQSGTVRSDGSGACPLERERRSPVKWDKAYGKSPRRWNSWQFDDFSVSGPELRPVPGSY